MPQKCPLPGKTHSRRSEEHSIGVLLISLSVLWMKKKTVLYFQYLFYTSILGKDQELFLKNFFKVFSRLSVFSLYNSESSPKILQLFYNSNHHIV